jgi:hypothetical protein
MSRQSPLTMMVFATSTASSTTFVSAVPDMMSTKDKTFAVTPPERAGRPIGIG